MKTALKNTALFGTALLVSTLTFAQPPAPPAPGRGPAGPPPPPGATASQEVSTVSGRVVKLSANDDYVYDGFYLITNGDSLLVKFPPHMGAQITKAAPVGTNVTVKGAQRTSPEGRKEIRMVSLTAGGQTITDAPPTAKPTPPTEEAISGSGKITAVQTGRRGEVKGVIVDGKTIVHLPPHVAMQLSGALQTGGTVSYTGNKKAANNGEATSGNYTVVHASTITVNGKQYPAQ